MDKVCAASYENRDKAKLPLRHHFICPAQDMVMLIHGVSFVHTKVQPSHTRWHLSTLTEVMSEIREYGCYVRSYALFKNTEY